MKVSIFTVWHGNNYPEWNDNKIFFPLCVGDSFAWATTSQLTQRESLRFLQDADGDNIADRNPYYSELTALYWIWRNRSFSQEDMVGICHYRRCFDFCERHTEEAEFSPVFLDSAKWSSILDSETIANLIADIDVLIPVPLRFSQYEWFASATSVFRQYNTSPDHYIDDLIMACDIIKRDFPAMTAVVDATLKSSELLIGNMFVMRFGLLDSYCAWVFPILDEMYQKIEVANRSAYGKRAIGFVAERLFTLWIKWIKIIRPDLEIGYANFLMDETCISTMPWIFDAKA